ncbi:hypothetical protein DL93DRAFT_2050436 [Clavulina sp. PMI_390]|nr:hypothetical protein DL93DRAFT_2050436 [Clavulina sp. PMI_390]
MSSEGESDEPNTRTRSGPSGGDPHSATGSSNKKRKVQRACDLCRRKKVRCDAAQSSTNRCSNCTVIGTDCTFISEAKKRGPPKGYVESLEKRLEKMEDLLQKQAAESSASSPAGPSNDDKDKFSRSNRTIPSQKSTQPPRSSSASTHEVTLLKDFAATKAIDCAPVDQYDVEFETSDDDVGPDQLPDIITDAMQDLSLGENGIARFHGKSSSLMLIRAASDLKKQHGIDVGTTRRAEFWTPAEWEWELRDSGPPSTVTFPPDDLMQTLFGLFFRHFIPFLPIIHRPTFDAQFRDGAHHKNTPFAIVVLLVCAIASRYCDDPRVCLKDGGRPSAGWKYFVQVKDLKRSLHAPATLNDLQTYALVAYYLQATSAPHSAWTVIGIGIRCAQDIGVHRKKIYRGTISLQDEQWKRVFWCLITLDRYVSSALGRPLACQDEEWVPSLPEILQEIDDEYWPLPTVDSSAVPVPRQPEGIPSSISYFVAYLKLGQILAFALRTIYTINKSKVLLGFVGERWEQHIVAELDSAMNKWLDAVPDHLKWDPNRQDPMHFEQSAVLYAAYYHLHIMIHRPFIPSPKKPAVLSFPSLTICTNAARSCSHVVEALGKRSQHVLPSTLVAAFTSGIVLLIAIWGAKKTGLSVDYKVHMNDVDKCLVFLQQSEKDWHYSGRLVDILRELASFGELGSEQNPPTHKRDRSEVYDGIPTPPSSEGRATEDESTRSYRPMPRSRQVTQPQPSTSAAASSTPSSTMTTPPQHPTPPSGNPLPRTQWAGPTGGLAMSPTTQFLQTFGRGMPDAPVPPTLNGVNPPQFFDAAMYAAALGGDLSGIAPLPTSSSDALPAAASTSSMSAAASWDGILSQQPSNPYANGLGNAAMTMSPDFFNPYLGYQGPGGPMGFAAEAQAFLGNVEGLDWASAFNFG